MKLENKSFEQADDSKYSGVNVNNEHSEIKE